MVCLFQVMQLMSDEKDSLVFEEAPDAAVEEVAAHLGINSREGIVKQVEVGLSVAGTCEGDSCTLTS